MEKILYGVKIDANGGFLNVYYMATLFQNRSLTVFMYVQLDLSVYYMAI